MPDVSLTDFVEFAIKSGPAQWTKVQQLAARGDYDPRHDFWKALRESIKDSAAGTRKLDDVLTGLTDPKKIKKYPGTLKGYRKFLAHKSVKFFKPPYSVWTYDSLRVRVNPEIGVEIAGEKYFVKLYFSDEKPTKHRLKVVFELMRLALKPPKGVGLAVLEVPTGRLIPANVLDESLVPLLEAQAMAFIHMWNAVKGRGAALSL